MSEPYIGEIRMFAGNFAPVGWAFCDGQLLPISGYDALFPLIGTRYGGNGQTTFGLPDLRGRIPVHNGTGPGLSPRQIGQKAGSEGVTLTVNQIPSHTHRLASTDPATLGDPVGRVVGDTGVTGIYSNSTPLHNMNSVAAGTIGGNQPHNNMMPYQCVNFIIALFGLYPSRS